MNIYCNTMSFLRQERHEKKYRIKSRMWKRDSQWTPSLQHQACTWKQLPRGNFPKSDVHTVSRPTHISNSVKINTCYFCPLLCIQIISDFLFCRFPPSAIQKLASVLTASLSSRSLLLFFYLLSVLRVKIKFSSCEWIVATFYLTVLSPPHLVPICRYKWFLKNPKEVSWCSETPKVRWEFNNIKLKN